ncbi:ATP-dependent endonuclease [Streptomyces cyaneofuscatus]|uniref:ATP-dependent nuclease n=1 Tax=Streptomyces cyaneofuscatus TaxID=66883 RepID=UPI003646F653
MSIAAENGGNPNDFLFSVRSVVLDSGQTLELPGSGVTAIVGPNNSGKSTLLRQIRSSIIDGESYSTETSGFRLVRRVQIETSGTDVDAFAWFTKHASARQMPHGLVYRVRDGVEFHHSRLVQKIQENFSAGISELEHVLISYGDAWGRIQGAQPVEQRDYFSDSPMSPLHVLQDNQLLFDELKRINLRVFGQTLTLDRLSRQVNLRVGDSSIPAPPVDRLTADYLDSLASLPKVSDQGDGVRSLIGILAPLVTSTHPVVIIDEPEAFLHPPQATALGRILGEQARMRGIQVILATHDKNLLAGLLESEADTSIVRLSRSVENVTSAHQLDVAALRSIWNDPVLRYSNVLDGLFHRLVVLAEGDRDCRFYAAALESADSESQFLFPPGDVLFVPSGGKAGMPRLARVLRAVNVPVVATPDLDVLNSREVIKAVVESVGGDWESLEKDYRLATEQFRQPREQATIGQVLAALNGVFAGRHEEAFTAEIRRDFAAQIRAKESPWSALKDYGELAFKGQSAQAAHRLLGNLDSIGVVTVRVGELEGFAPALGVAKGAAWLPAAIAAGVHKDAAAQKHVMTLVASPGRA